MQLTDFPLGAFDDACDGLKLLVTAFEKMGGSHVAVSALPRAVRTIANSIIGRTRR